MGDRLSLAALILVPVALFWPHLSGEAMFIGDSDRLSHHLPWLHHLAEGLRRGELATWNNALFGGYSTVAIPYTFPNPFALFVLLWATGFIGAGYAMPYAEPFTFLFVRFVLTSLLLGALVWWWRAARLSARVPNGIERRLLAIERSGGTGVTTGSGPSHGLTSAASERLFAGPLAGARCSSGLSGR